MKVREKTQIGIDSKTREEKEKKKERKKEGKERQTDTKMWRAKETPR